MKTIFSLALLSQLPLMTPPAAFATERSCVKATIAWAGETCESVRVTFDLSKCGGTAREKTVAASCGKNPHAEITTDSGSYSVKLRSQKGSWGGVMWELEPVLPRRSIAHAEDDVKKPEQTAQELTKTNPPAMEKTVAVLGDFRLRLESSDRTDFSSTRGMTLVRARPMVKITPDSSFAVFIQPQFAKTFGEPTYQAAGATSNTLTVTSGGSSDPSLLVHQAFVDYKVGDFGTATLGRYALAYGDELLIGASNWGNVSRSFDLARARMNHKFGWSDVFYSKLSENNSTSTTLAAGDRDFYGLYNGMSFGPALNEADLYVLDLRNASLGQNLIADVWTLGARAKSKINAFDYRAEFAKQWNLFAQGPAGAQAHLYDLELGYTAHFLTRARFAVDGLVATQDFNPLFVSAHKWLGYADVLGLRNVVSAKAHIDVDVLPNVRFDFDYLYFARASTERPAYATNATTALGTVSRSGSKNLGNELDFTLRYKPIPLVSLSGGYSVFIPGEYFESQFGSSAPTFGYLQTEFSF